MEVGTRGLLTVRVQFVEDILRIEILNARNLHPMDVSGKCVFITSMNMNIIYIFME